MATRDVVIVSAVRTPIGSFCGSLSSLKASDLGSVVIKEALERANLKGSDVSEVIMGQALTAGQGQNPARQACLKSGLPVATPAYSINMLCGSGLKAVANGYLSVKSGESEVVVAGGQESMSQAPHAIHMRSGIKMGEAKLIDTMQVDGLTDVFSNVPMGVTAENIAKKFAIGRKEQDEYAVKSQQQAKAAITAGYFSNEIVPVSISLPRKQVVVVSTDEFPKPEASLETLAKLSPVFVKNEGTVTAGNASGLNDGAAAVVLMSADYAAERGAVPLAKIVATAQTGIDPDIMGMGPVSAIQLVVILPDLKKANWTKEEVDLYELNEAFAVQTLACLKELALNPDKVNVNGGAIALGHPIGASGTRILVTLLHLLVRTGGKKGVAALCIGGGMGIAMAIERQ